MGFAYQKLQAEQSLSRVCVMISKNGEKIGGKPVKDGTKTEEPVRARRLGRAGCRYWRLWARIAYAVIDSTAMSAAMGCIAGARQITMVAISQTIRPPRGPFPELRMGASFATSRAANGRGNVVQR